MEFHRSDSITRHRFRRDRRLWRVRSERWRKFQSLLAVWTLGADRRGRYLEGQFLRHQEFAQPLEQFYLFSQRSRQQRSISPARRPRSRRYQWVAYLQKSVCWLTDGDRNRRANPT